MMEELVDDATSTDPNPVRQRNAEFSGDMVWWPTPGCSARFNLLKRKREKAEKEKKKLKARRSTQQ